MRKLVITYGTLIGTNYLVVFVLLVIIYIKVLQRIKVLRKRYGQWMLCKSCWDTNPWEWNQNLASNPL